MDLGDPVFLLSSVNKSVSFIITLIMNNEIDLQQNFPSDYAIKISKNKFSFV